MNHLLLFMLLIIIQASSAFLVPGPSYSLIHRQICSGKILTSPSRTSFNNSFLQVKTTRTYNLALHSKKKSTSDDEANNIIESEFFEEVGTNGLTTPFDKPILASLDFVSLVTFAAIGKASHSADGSLDIGAVLTTAFPFLFSWFATSPLTGIYNEISRKGKENNELLGACKMTLKGWVVAVPLGIVGRGLIKGYMPPVPFIIVTMIATLVILTAVRLLYTIVEGKVIQQE